MVDGFNLSQVYAIIVLPNGGPDLEAYTFTNAGKDGWRHACSLFWQIARTLAQAEELVQFEVCLKKIVLKGEDVIYEFGVDCSTGTFIGVRSSSRIPPPIPSQNMPPHHHGANRNPKPRLPWTILHMV